MIGSLLLRTMPWIWPPSASAASTAGVKCRPAVGAAAAPEGDWLMPLGEGWMRPREAWQAARWGEDAEAAERNAALEQAAERMVPHLLRFAVRT